MEKRQTRDVREEKLRDVDFSFSFNFQLIILKFTKFILILRFGQNDCFVFK